MDLDNTHPLVTITAHRNKAKNVGGTTTPLTQNNMRSFEIGMRARPVCKNQYRKTQRRPAAIGMSTGIPRRQIICLLTIDACAFGEVIGKVYETWPDSLDTSLKEVTGLYSKDGGPHERDECCHRLV